MRGLPLRATAASLACLGVWAGCSFTSPRAGGADTPDDAPDGQGEPDAGPAPLCMTEATYTANPATGRRYRIGPTNINYDAAIDFCAASGAHLAVVDDAAENAYLVTLFNGGEGWIGLDDLTEENTFQWITGSTGAYRNFKAPDPNNTNNEDCVGLRDDESWHDGGCEDAHRPLCECDPAYRPPPTPLCRTMNASSFEASGRRVFRSTANAKWVDAKAACEAIGAHLLVIGDLSENAEMDAQLAGAFWLGYTDRAQEGTFRWDNGAMSTYKNWGNGGGVPQEDDEDCAVLQDGGLWETVECGDSNPYACECDPAPP
jgi:hypothetical protein